jgi:hypothetical protein
MQFPCRTLQDSGRVRPAEPFADLELSTALDSHGNHLGPERGAKGVDGRRQLLRVAKLPGEGLRGRPAGHLSGAGVGKRAARGVDFKQVRDRTPLLVRVACKHAKGDPMLATSADQG